jgi:hypothetical protein
MTFRLALAVLVIGHLPTYTSGRAAGAVVIVANRTGGEIRFSLSTAQAKDQPYAVAAGDLAAIPVAGAADIAFGAGAARRHYHVEPNSAYYFTDLPDGLNLKEIGLRGGDDRPERPADGRAPVVSEAAPKTGPPAARVITVKILVDQKEIAVRKVWEKRLRDRVAAASKVLDHICRVTLNVVAVEEWQSDDAHADLPALFRDFERRVDAGPAQVAIGFTSQQPPEGGDARIGVTRSALHHHILMREWRPTSENGRVDVLVHELGHYLGAAHNPEADSLMRPRFGERPQVQGNRRSGFDPVSALIMNLVAEEVFDRRVKRLSDLSPGIRERLREIYAELARALPDDPTPAEYLRQLGGMAIAPDAP